MMSVHTWTWPPHLPLLPAVLLSGYDVWTPRLTSPIKPRGETNIQSGSHVMWISDLTRAVNLRDHQSTFRAASQHPRLRTTQRTEVGFKWILIKKEPVKRLQYTVSTKRKERAWKPHCKYWIITSLCMPRLHSSREKKYNLPNEMQRRCSLYKLTLPNSKNVDSSFSLHRCATLAFATTCQGHKCEALSNTTVYKVRLLWTLNIETKITFSRLSITWMLATTCWRILWSVMILHHILASKHSCNYCFSLCLCVFVCICVCVVMVSFHGGCGCSSQLRSPHYSRCPESLAVYNPTLCV